MSHTHTRPPPHWSPEADAETYAAVDLFLEKSAGGDAGVVQPLAARAPSIRLGGVFL